MRYGDTSDFTGVVVADPLGNCQHGHTDCCTVMARNNVRCSKQVMLMPSRTTMWLRNWVRSWKDPSMALCRRQGTGVKGQEPKGLDDMMSSRSPLVSCACPLLPSPPFGPLGHLVYRRLQVSRPGPVPL